MTEESTNSRPSELVYVPQPSWYPALIAAGLAGVLASLWIWWPYGAAGAIVGLLALFAMIKDSGEELDRLPRHQRITTGPIPAETLKRPGAS